MRGKRVKSLRRELTKQLGRPPNKTEHFVPPGVPIEGNEFRSVKKFRKKVIGENK